MAKVLIVDDHAAARLHLSTLLAYYGHATCEASNAGGVVEALQRDRPDLVIVDVGLAALFERPRTIPLVLTCAVHREEEAKGAAEKLASPPVLWKPIGASQLLGTLSRLGFETPSPKGSRKVQVLLEGVAAQLATLVELSAAFADEADPAQLLALLARTASSLLDVERVLVGAPPVRGQPGRAFLATRSAVTPVPWTGPPGDALVREALWLRRVKRLTGPVAAAELGGVSAEREALVVPLCTPREALGWMALVDRRSGQLGSLDERLASLVAGQAALQYEHLLLLGEARRASERLDQGQRLESIGRLAGGVAHEFNNLLTAVTGRAERVLERLPAGDPLRVEVEEIRCAADRAVEVTRQLLAFSQRQVLRPKLLDLGAQVKEVLPLLSRLLGEDVQVTSRIDPAPTPVLVDPSQVQQVLMTLALEAREAMPRGGRLVLEVRPAPPGTTDAGEWIELLVQDSGSGMTPERLAHLFEPFFTSTSLGLPTVHGIVTQSGGKVSAESAQGAGTRFRVLFPRAREAAAPATAPASRPPAGRVGRSTVLVVEDEELVRELVVAVLLGQGHDVLTAASAEEALRLSRQRSGPIDLLVSDVVMPGMGGPELAQAIHEHRPGLPVLFMSGYSEEAVERHGVLVEGSELLPKPFRPAALVERVRRLLGR